MPFKNDYLSIQRDYERALLRARQENIALKKEIEELKEQFDVVDAKLKAYKSD